MDSDAACDRVRSGIQRLVQRYQHGEFGLAKEVFFSQHRETTRSDAWGELLSRKWVTLVGEGHVVLRGPTARLAAVVDRRVDTVFASSFAAEREYYPATILCDTLDRVDHFKSFPEHLDFVSHLRRDVSLIEQFSDDCRANGWSPRCMKAEWPSTTSQLRHRVAITVMRVWRAGSLVRRDLTHHFIAALSSLRGLQPSNNVSTSSVHHA